MTVLDWIVKGVAAVGLLYCVFWIGGKRTVVMIALVAALGLLALFALQLVDAVNGESRPSEVQYERALP